MFAPKLHLLVEEIFLASLDAYNKLMSLWVSYAVLNDPCEEFFIKVNPESQLAERSLTASELWELEFDFRLTDKHRELQSVCAPGFLKDHTEMVMRIGKQQKVNQFIAQRHNLDLDKPNTDFYKAVVESINQVPVVNCQARTIDQKLKQSLISTLYKI